MGAGSARNSPCRCGSGKKWKHCCGRDTRELDIRPFDFTNADREYIAATKQVERWGVPTSSTYANDDTAAAVTFDSLREVMANLPPPAPPLPSIIFYPESLPSDALRTCEEAGIRMIPMETDGDACYALNAAAFGPSPLEACLEPFLQAQAQERYIEESFRIRVSPPIWNPINCYLTSVTSDYSPPRYPWWMRAIGEVNLFFDIMLWEMKRQHLRCWGADRC